MVHCHHELPETPVKVTKQGAKVHQGSKVCNPIVVKDEAAGVFQGRDGRVIAVLVGLDGIVDGFGPELQTSGVRVFRTHSRLRQGNYEVSLNSYILLSIDFCLFKACVKLRICHLNQVFEVSICFHLSMYIVPIGFY